MRIKITKSDLYRADLVELPGTPPVGVGSSPEEAVANLFFRLLHPGDNAVRGVYGREDWLRYIDWGKCEVEKGY